MTAGVKELVIMGTRGIPAQHGGFETFAEHLSLFLVEKGWKVTVYCQEEGAGETYETSWLGIKRVHIPISSTGPLGTILFDYLATIDSLKREGVFLTLGYNTAVFNLLHRVFRKKNIINMDGVEWKRAKWGLAARTWFWFNEKFACVLGNHLVADHPEIANHLSSVPFKAGITVIPYGAKEVVEAKTDVLSEFDLAPYEYGIVIARPEPENSILEIVEAFSTKPAHRKLVVLGKYEPEKNEYHRRVTESAGDNVLFLGAIYDAAKLAALRFYSRAYIHGHQVGGTNPSLVEALGCGVAILAHDNRFNRWVAKEAAEYFGDVSSARRLVEDIFSDDLHWQSLKNAARDNFSRHFQLETIHNQYEKLLLEYSDTATIDRHREP